MNNNDAFAPLMNELFSVLGDPSPSEANYRNIQNGLIYKADSHKAVSSRRSARMDFRHADRADTQKLDILLRKDAMGEKPIPRMLFEKTKKSRGEDDD